jgi:hypothetical protein
VEAETEAESEVDVEAETEAGQAPKRNSTTSMSRIWLKPKA